MDKDFLAQYEINYDLGVKNCMGDPAFYKNLLSMFLEDDCFPRAQRAYAQGNHKELFSCLHELKGATGNAALTGLYDAIVPLIELLREGTDDNAEVTRLFEAADRVYQRTYDGVAKAIAQ